VIRAPGAAPPGAGDTPAAPSPRPAGAATHGHHQHDREENDGIDGEQWSLQDLDEEAPPQEAPYHEDFAMGKVDHLQDPVHHGEAQGQERIDAPRITPKAICWEGCR